MNSMRTTFFPALVAIPLSLYMGLVNQMLLESISSYYILMIAMIFGSMIAGSMPMGGGIVGFPVSVLVYNFVPANGRDFSLMIQSFGMTAASFSIITNKRALLKGHRDTILSFCYFSFIGVLIGLPIKIDPFAVNVFYTTAIVCFAILLYSFDKPWVIEDTGIIPSVKDNQTEENSEENSEVNSEDNSIEDVVVDGRMVVSSNEKDLDATESQIKSDKKSKKILYKLTWTEKFGLVLLSLIGGLISSQIGSGADIMSFAYCCILKHVRSNRLDSSNKGSLNEFMAAFNPNSLTAISVIVMTFTSILGSACRVASQEVDPKVYQAVLACSFIVVFGAPLGSLFLKPKYEVKLRSLFYLFAGLQLIVYGLIKIQGKAMVWLGMCIAIGICILVSMVFRSKNEKSLPWLTFKIDSLVESIR